nr:hypothetical transcript [Hymenolepis microstoma]
MKDSNISIILAQTLEQNTISRKDEMEFVLDCYNEISNCQFEKFPIHDQTVLYQCNECEDFLKYSTSGDQYTLTAHHLQPLTERVSNNLQIQTYEDNYSFLKNFKREGQLKDFEYSYHNHYVYNEGQNYEGLEMKCGNKKLWIEHCAIDDLCPANAVFTRKSMGFTNGGGLSIPLVRTLLHLCFREL